jgi:UDP-glucose 4-epimerase
MLTGKNVRFYEADTRDYSALVRIFESECRSKPIHSVIHLAGLKAVGESVAKPHRKYAISMHMITMHTAS